MKLNDKEITFYANNLGRPLVKPFREEQLTPNGYDLNIGEIKINDHIYNIDIEDITIPPKTFFIVMTEEYARIPDDVIAHLWIRHSHGRKGIILSASVVDAGYNGKIALTMYNASDKPVTFEKDKKRTIVQIEFEKIIKPHKIYTQRSGSWQNQKTLK